MNLSDFSLLKEDDQHYTIGHPKGRSIMVKKEGLSPKAHEEIKKMSKGGLTSQPGPADNPTPENTGDGYYRDDSAGDDSNRAPASQPDRAPASILSDIGDAASKVWDAAKNSPWLGGPGDQSPAPQAAPAPVPQAQAANRAPSVAAPMAAPQTQQDMMGPDTSQMNAALQKEKSAIQAGAAAEGAEGMAGQKAYQDYQNQMALQPSPDDIFKSHQKADQDLMKAFMDQKIDPNHYVHSMSTGSKIASAIGMILSGAGSGTTGQPNLAVQHLNNAIQNDIDAQKNDQSKSMNLWKMNREATQDEMQAGLATQNQMLNVVKAKMLQAAGAAQGPMAAARIAPVVSQINQQIAQNDWRRSLLQSSQTGGMSNLDPAILVPQFIHNPEDQKKAYEEIGRAQNVSKNSQAIMDAFDEAAKDTTVTNTLGGAREPGSVMRLKQLLLPNFKQVDGTVRQAAMDETFNNVIPSGWDGEDKKAHRKQALADWMHSETAAPFTKGASNGLIDLQRFKSTSANPVSSGMYKPGTVITESGRKFVIGADGHSLTPIK